MRKRLVLEFPKLPPLGLLIKGIIRMEMSMDHWWNNSDRGKPEVLEENTSQ
jgi:hypothetical protein